MPQQDDVKQIRTLIDDWAAGLRAKDAKRVKRHGAKDLVHFSLAPPLVADESGPKRMEKWFKTWDGPLGYELRDLEIVSGDGVAFSDSLNHLTGTQRGEKQDLWFRSTLGFARSVASGRSRTSTVGAVPHGRQRQGRTRSQSLTVEAAAPADTSRPGLRIEPDRRSRLARRPARDCPTTPEQSRLTHVPA